MSAGRRGRPAGATTTRADVLRAARELFAEQGFTATTIRAVARRAGVDPALVLHYFGSKDDLLAAALELPFDPAPLVDLAGAEPFDAESFVRTVLRFWDDASTRLQMRARLRIAVSGEQAGEMLRDLLTRQLVAPLAERIGGADAEYRASLVAAQLVGLAMLRFVIPLPALAKADEQQVVATVAPAVRRYLTEG